MRMKQSLKTSVSKLQFRFQMQVQRLIRERELKPKKRKRFVTSRCYVWQDVERGTSRPRRASDPFDGKPSLQARLVETSGDAGFNFEGVVKEYESTEFMDE